MAPSEFPRDGSLHIHADERNGVVRLRFEGELDLASEQAVERALRQATRAARSEVVVDLSGLDFMDSTGLSVLLRAHQRSHTEELAPIRTVGARGAVEKLLQLSGVQRVLLGQGDDHPAPGGTAWQPLFSSRP